MSEEIYDKMWQRFKVASETDQYELDSHLLDLPTTHEKGLRVTFDSRYKQVTAHSSLIRFRSPINNAQRLFNLCEQYRNHTFGRITLNDFELVFNNWYQHLDITQSLS